MSNSMGISSNPITRRVTRSWRILSPRAVTVIGAGAGLAGFGLALALSLWPVYAILVTVLTVVIGVASTLLPLSCPLIGLSVAGQLTARYASSDEYALLRITTLTAESIFQGYVEVSLVHFRLILSLSQWGLLAALPILSITIGGDGFGTCDSALSCLVAGFLPALIIILAAAVFIRLMTRALIVVGVWLALRWPAWQRLLTGAAMLAGLISCILVSVLPFVFGLSLSPALAVIVVAVPALGLGAAQLLARFARADARRVIGRAVQSTRAGL